jgi:surface antigen
MRAWTKAGVVAGIGSLLAFSVPFDAQSASLAHGRGAHHKAAATAQHETGGGTKSEKIAVRLSPGEPHSNSKHSLAKNAKARLYGHHYVGISCVPYARSVSGIELQGNAAQWWYAASGVYERGSRPEENSVLNFRANGHMRLGHVAVVTHVVNSREVEIDHANWWGPGAGKGGISRGIPVVDVSENNDWSEVRVGLGHTGTYGSVYATYGFIYDRPDRGTVVANNLPRAQMVRVATAPAVEEVAEAVEPRRRSPFFAPLNHSLR